MNQSAAQCQFLLHTTGQRTGTTLDKRLQAAHGQEAFGPRGPLPLWHAEDICMEAMLIYWEKRDSLQPGTNIPAYILTIVKNRALNHLQHMHVRLEVEDRIMDHPSRELNLRISTRYRKSFMTRSGLSLIRLKRCL